jgi:type I restriction enzyme, S subunit
MSFPRYLKYKDSGVEWLGEVPEDWHVSRLGFESWVRARLGWKGLKAEEYVDDGFVFLSTPNLKGPDIDFENVNYINAIRFEESPEIKLQAGDVLLAKDGSTLGTVNVVRSLPRPATVNGSIAVITPNDRVEGLFLYYLFQSQYIVDTIQRIKGGMGVPHLFQEDLRKFYLAHPGREEQAAIVDFLEREIKKIDALVEEQRRLIELLKEKRQAVISQVVTKGLNPDAPMNPSGIDWIGDIPAHWRIHALRRFPCFVQTGPFGSQLHAEEYLTGGTPVINPLNLLHGRIAPSEDVTVSDDVVNRLRHQRLQVGDIVFSRRGELGRCALVSETE